MSEKPLHVRVAEALGWTELRKVGGIPIANNWAGWPPGAIPLVGHPRPEAIAPRYDTDWQSTGSLIEKYEICLERSGIEWGAYRSRDMSAHGPWFYGKGSTPLLAVCRLILALKEAGKLEAA